MTVFTNNMTVKGRINHIGSHVGEKFSTLFLKIGFKHSFSNGNEEYESVNARITVKIDNEGKPVVKNNSARSLQNVNIFNYLNNNAVVGMPIELYGAVRGSDMAYVNGYWKLFKSLTEDERAVYEATKIAKNETYLYIEEAQLLARKEEFLARQEKQEPDGQQEGMKAEQEKINDAEKVEEKDLDNDELEVIEAEIIEQNEANRRQKASMSGQGKREGYVPFDSVVFPDILVDDPIDLPY
ncbi:MULTISPECIES: hypothetical protein [Vagococcus]|uniref:Uncharacterized protein n=1 Tax=Vagococcus fluvialis bH819 TaxID=1255619 RepID=A0A1X6WS67_9ENTE|nr:MULTISPECIES: hypothetical protein [Vagococcus]SLM87082.1 hypothetical protein FM121_13370 [Vagococcus fluvialis bH819]HCM90569.1 hypothetical protein [Vagococcus sp.]